MRAAALLLPSIFLCLLLASCGNKATPTAEQADPQEVVAEEQIVPLPVEPVTLTSPEGREIVVSAEMATTREEQERGLMFRKSLAPQSGMVFTMGEERTLTFWMKDTLIALGILYFDADGRFVSSATMDPCKKDPCPTSTSKSPASIVLEVPAGFVKKHNIGEGWTITLP